MHGAIRRAPGSEAVCQLSLPTRPAFADILGVTFTGRSSDRKFVNQNGYDIRSTLLLERWARRKSGRRLAPC
jgi:hypothetical protein